MKSGLLLLLASALALAIWHEQNTPEGPGSDWNKECHILHAPFLQRPPLIDGDLDDWKLNAFSDGLWDIFRVARSPWYDAGRNRLTDHGGEPALEDDLRARYYIAWDRKYLYFGADVVDNANDTSDPAHEPRRWYYKDSICWFIEAPRDATSERFGRGDNGFCFVADSRKPPYGAWWRHGTGERSGIEEPLPRAAVDYAIRLKPSSAGSPGFTLEARVEMAPTLGVSDPAWRPPQIGDEYGLQIVHCDPDGGDYGGHLLLYGTGDNDASWGIMRLAGPASPPGRRQR